MRLDLIREIELPENIEAELDHRLLKIRGPKGETQREFLNPVINIIIKNKKIAVSAKKASKKEKKIINTTIAHIKNLIKGALEEFVYEMKICSGHFPMNPVLEKDKLIIKNFLGERHPREARILEGVNVDMSDDKIIIKSIDKEKAGQTASNIELATKVKNRDRRVFQDGIFLVSKSGRKI